MTSQLKLICVLAHPDKFLKAMEVGRTLTSACLSPHSAVYGEKK